jgi:VWFA-related protein
VTRPKAPAKRYSVNSKGAKGDCDSAIPKVHAYAKNVYDEVDNSLASLETLVRSLSTLEGRKAILYISDGLELFPGQDTFEYLATECGGDQQSMGQLAQEYDISQVLIRLAAIANSKDTTIVAVEAIGPRSSSAGPARAKQKPSGGNQPTGIVMKSADGVPMVPVAGLGASGSSEPTLEQIRTRNLQSSMAFLANQTGGVTVFNTKNFKTPFDTLSQDLLPYYSLEFAPDRAPDGKVHVLELRTAKKGVETRYNQSFFDQRASRDYGDRLLAYLLYQTNEPNRLGVQVEMLPAEGAAKGIQTAQITVQLASVVLRPHQGELVGRLNFLAVSQNAQGETTRLQQATADIAPMPGATEHVQQFPIEMLPGQQILAIAVVDVGGEMASFVKQDVKSP